MDSRKDKRLVNILKKNPSATVNIFYLVGIVLFFIGIILFILIRYTEFASWFLNDTPDCYIEEMTGIYCPGCGLSRSVIALFQFNFLKSFVAHPLVLYLFTGYFILMAKETLFRLKGENPVKEKIFLYFVYGGIIITIIQWIIKAIFAIIM